MGIYIDNASTSFPKPLKVSQAVMSFINNIGASPSRGSYSSAMKAQQILLDAREAICDMFNAPAAKNIIFTSGATLSLNMLINGINKTNSHFVTTSMEHNAVMRTLKASGSELTIVNANKDGTLDPTLIAKAIKPNTVAVITTHASNVCGTILPIEEIYTICKKHNIIYLVDAAQTAGIIPITLESADAIAFAGHKGLYGPQGIGGIAIKSELAKRLDAFISGGTGSASHEEIMPTRLPDKFEAGTLNMPGICGLLEGIKFINSFERGELLAKEMELCKRLLEGFLNIDGVRLLGLKATQGRTGVVSLCFDKTDNAQASYILDTEYDIQTRCGLHCAPRAHKTLGSFEEGAVRFSIGAFNTNEDINNVITAVAKIAKGT